MTSAAEGTREAPLTVRKRSWPSALVRACLDDPEVGIPVTMLSSTLLGSGIGAAIGGVGGLFIGLFAGFFAPILLAVIVVGGGSLVERIGKYR